MLTIQQKQHFETFGFLVLRQLFTPQEIDVIRRESDAVLRENRQGKPFPGEKRQAMIPFFELNPRLQWLIEDDRIYALGEDLLGPDFILNATEGNLHVGDTQWHGGGLDAEPVPHIKIAFYLEPNTKDTGALRFIPGTHKLERRKLIQPLTAQQDDPTAMPFGVAWVRTFPASSSNRSPAMSSSFQKHYGTGRSAAHRDAPSTPSVSWQTP